MRKRFGPALPAIALCLLLMASACGVDTPHNSPVHEGNSSDASARSTQLSVTSKYNATHRFTVDLAISDEAQRRGLMGRPSLAEHEGMLFPFAYPKMASFWMKDTLVPLDLLFIRPDGAIAGILSGEPGSLKPLASNEPVSAVLEIAGGQAKALGIAPGDRVQWGDCDGSQTPPDVWRPDRFCPGASGAFP